MEAPPLGLHPQKFWREDRVREIIAAMQRYLASNRLIPAEWVEELKQHTDWLR